MRHTRPLHAYVCFNEELSWMPLGLSLVVASDMHFQEMELWLSLNSHIFSGQLTEEKKKKRFKTSESFISSLKSNHYWLALGGGKKWVENIDM